MQREEEKIVFQPLTVDFLKGGFYISELTMCEQKFILSSVKNLELEVKSERNLDYFYEFL